MLIHQSKKTFHTYSAFSCVHRNRGHKANPFILRNQNHFSMSLESSTRGELIACSAQNLFDLSPQVDFMLHIDTTQPLHIHILMQHPKDRNERWAPEGNGANTR